MKKIKLIVAICCLSVFFTFCKQQGTKSESSDHSVSENAATLTPQQILKKLISGNQNFASSLSSPHYDHGHSYNYFDQVGHTKADQHPIAFILSCMDSRVPPEIIFDQGIGELFSDRVAGNVEDLYILGSMEYAVNIKKVKVIVVMGHKNCGAVNAVFGQVDSSSNEELVPLIAHVREGSVPNDSPPYDASAKHNVVKTIDHILTNSRSIRSKVDSGEAIIVGALYDVATGKVDWDYKNW